MYIRICIMYVYMCLCVSVYRESGSARARARERASESESERDMYQVSHRNDELGASRVRVSEAAERDNALFMRQLAELRLELHLAQTISPPSIRSALAEAFAGRGVVVSGGAEAG